MRILITGVSGQVGGALARRLEKSGTLLLADRAILDFAHPEQFSAKLDQLGPDLIINPAAYTAVDKAESEQDLAMTVNAAAPGMLARWAASHDVPLIHFSTDYVFSGEGEQAWCEDDPTHPLSVYGATKLAGENELRAAAGCSLIVRTSWVYAASGKNFLWTIGRLAQERKELRIVADQVGAPTSASLIADAIGLMIEGGLARLRDRMAQAKGTVHLAAGGQTSWHGFATAIIEGLRLRGAPLAVEEIVPIRTDEYPTPARRPRNSRLSLARLQDVFAVMPADWRTALSSELDQFAREIGAVRPATV
jgi:dTDP-4-dehydrorhamnose reductase